MLLDSTPMDNLTHSLFGLAVAETALSFRRKKSVLAAGIAPAACALSVAANNVCDLDFVYSGITEGRLGYLLHHRGHTHTLPAAVPLAGLVLAVAYFFLRKKTWSKSDWKFLGGLTLLGPFTHLLLDFMNSYGVHPFWPLENSWYYGDTLFIIEPFAWTVLAAGLFFSGSKWMRVFAGGVVAVAVILSRLSGIVPWPSTAVLLAVAAAILFLVYRRKEQAGIISLVSLLLLIVVFASFSRYTKSKVMAWRHTEAPQAKVADIIASPQPGNPFCWAINVIETEGLQYRMLRTSFSVLGGECLRSVTTSLPMEEISPGVHRWETPLSELSHWFSHHCGFREFTRFARAPFILPRGAQLYVGDLRYDRDDSLGFAEILFPSEMKSCPKNIPPWIPPRLSLLEPPRLLIH